MATKYNLTTNFTAITETSGTIQNVGNEVVELVSTTNETEGEGILLAPHEKRTFNGALSARSAGDAGAAVNVVDFIEAGKGGGGGSEYILPVASDTKLGGVKISNSFTVASDGTLSIKKSGKTILGGVKSSDDEGKVTVNNDGTMTCNPLGYRQPSTAYTAGAIAYHASLPTGWYLECTTTGTTGSGDLSISSPSIGGTVSDGTMVWTVSSDLRLSGGTMTGPLTLTNTNDSLTINGSTIQNGVDTRSFSIYSTGAYLGLFPKNYRSNTDKGAFILGANDGNNINYALMGRIDGSLNWHGNDLAGSAIVAKSIGTNGYIKYASVLILQWGMYEGNFSVDGYSSHTISWPLSANNWLFLGATFNTDNSQFPVLKFQGPSIIRSNTGYIGGVMYFAICM